MSLSNLPPGVTQSMIDRHFEGPCPECADGKHDECDDSECVCVPCEESAAEDAAEIRAEARREARMFGEDY